METKVSQRHDRVDDMYKIVLIGDMSVGKTGILQKFTESPDFPQLQLSSMPTIGVDFKVRTILVDGKRIKLQIWDTAGSERFRTLCRSYYRNALGCIIVYDITNKASFTNVQYWMEAFKSQTSNDIPVILLGNKLDVTRIGIRSVNRAQGEKLAVKLGMRFQEVSAKTGENIESSFVLLAKDIKEQRDKKFLEQQTSSSSKRIKIRPNPSNNSLRSSSWFSKMKCSIL